MAAEGGRREVPGYVWFGAKVFFFVASLFVGRISVYQVNNFIQMILVEKNLDPSLFPNDAYADSLRYYPIPMWHWIHPLFASANAISVLTILTLLLRVFVFWSAGRLALALTNGNKVAEIAAWAAFAAGLEPPVGSGTVFPFTFDHTAISVGLLMLATAEFLRHRRLTFGVCLGLAGFFNLMYALYGIAYFALIAAISPEHRKAYAQWALAAVGSLVLMIPSIQLSYQVFLNPKITPHEFALYNRLNYPYHYFPTTWSGLQWGRLALGWIAMLALAYLAPWRREVKAAALGITLLMPVFVLLAYIADIKEVSLLISTQPARATDVWYAFSSVAMAGTFAMIMATARSYKGLLGGLGGLLLSIAFWRYGWLDTKAGTAIAVAGGLAVLGSLATIPTAAVVTRKLKLVGAGVLAAVFALESVLALPRMKKPDGTLDILQPPIGPQTDAYNWIAENTPKNARFLVHPLQRDFRALAKRTPWLALREGSAVLWYPPYGQDWARRLQAMGVKDLERAASNHVAFQYQVDYNYRYVSDRNALALGRFENVDFWLIPVDQPTSLPAVYQDSNFKVVRIR